MAVHSTSPASLVARTVYTPESSGKASDKTRVVSPSPVFSILYISSSVIGWLSWNHVTSGVGSPVTLVTNLTGSPSRTLMSSILLTKSGEIVVISSTC